MVRKDVFLKEFYNCIAKDVVSAVDDLLLCIDRFDISDVDKPYVDVAMNYRYRPDLFSNVCFLVQFLVRMVDYYPQTHVLLDFNPKLSPAFLANLLTFNSCLNECKKMH